MAVKFVPLQRSGPIAEHGSHYSQIRINGGAVGEVQANVELSEGVEPIAVIVHLWIDEEYRGRGYGRRAVRALEKIWEAKGIHEIAAGNVLPQATGFWEALGYERTNRVFYRAGGLPEKLWIKAA